MIADLSPGLLLIVGALVAALLPMRIRRPVVLLLPILALLQLWGLAPGDHGRIALYGLELVTLRVDKLAVVFATIFLVATFLGLLYALYEDDVVQQVAALIYAGSAVGAVFAGDLVTLFLFWEGTAIASVLLIWSRGTRRAYDAGLRYLLIQVGSGVILMAGILIHYHATRSIAFAALGSGDAFSWPLATWLIFIAFGIKCAFPLVHNWVQDAYPEATISGTVLLSAFTTKLAVYALARGFAGTEILIPIGAIMGVFLIVFALIENDLRRVLAYSLNSQLGFMVVGVGIGTEMALNGTAAHAFSSIAYTAVLFMSIGAVLLRTGTASAADLGGLYKSMPLTATFCVVGAASISAVPFFSGFVSKSLILQAAMDGKYQWAWLLLLLASVGAVLHTGIKVPYRAFFGRDSGMRPAEAPPLMIVAMAITAAFCVLLGVWPGLLYGLLPDPIAYAPFTFDHVLTQLQLVVLTGLAFVVLVRVGLYPAEERSTILDTDWFLRKPGLALATAIVEASGRLNDAVWNGAEAMTARSTEVMRLLHGPKGQFGKTWPTGQMAFWTTVMLGAYLLVVYL